MSDLVIGRCPDCVYNVGTITFCERHRGPQRPGEPFIVGQPSRPTDNGGGLAVAAGGQALVDMLTAENARLRAELEAAMAVLSDAQWQGVDCDGTGYQCCPECTAHRDVGHATDCALAAVLQNAKTPRQP